MADGQRVGVDEPFTVGGEKLMFPGDKSHGASGWNIYNCRCTVAAAIKGHERKRETYQEWLDKKIEEAPEDTALDFKKAARASANKKQWEEYRAIVGDAVPKSFDKFQDWKYTNPKEWNYTKGLKRYLVKHPESNRKYYDAQQALKAEDITKGLLLPAEKVRAYIMPSGKREPYHIMQRMVERGITDDEVRSYSDNAKAMLVQWGGERRVYISNEGVSVMTRESDEWIYKTAWKTNDNDERMDRIMEVLKSAGL